MLRIIALRQGRLTMTQFRKGYILSYFKNHQENYSFSDLASKLGLSVSEIDAIISEMIDDTQLEYNTENMLVLTQKGRLAILNEQFDYISFSDEIKGNGIIHPESALPLDAVFIPENFLSKIK